MKTSENRSRRIKKEMREGKTNAQARKIKKYNEKSDESSHVDLAPMVDIALLLLMFFMVTTSFNKPNVFLMGLPKESAASKPVPVDPDFVMTIQIAKSGNVYIHRGLEGPSNVPKRVPFEQIEKQVQAIREQVLNDPKNTKRSEVVTVVKIHKESLYDSMINALDEVFRGGVQKWATTEMKPEEMAKIDELDRSAGGAQSK
ncbi:MAG: biopolymer transporter ExbD [Chloroherpetonaceae bacterium]|nr:biopolymer transporter ExbD [Chloroherpetonaceae bacterium]MDW8437096.1 biopolymer transporter ExbD [Chloroherpetonaceae bacterium]